MYMYMYSTLLYFATCCCAVLYYMVLYYWALYCTVLCSSADTAALYITSPLDPVLYVDCTVRNCCAVLYCTVPPQKITSAIEKNVFQTGGAGCVDHFCCAGGTGTVRYSAVQQLHATRAMV